MNNFNLKWYYYDLMNGRRKSKCKNELNWVKVRCDASLTTD